MFLIIYYYELYLGKVSEYFVYCRCFLNLQYKHFTLNHLRTLDCLMDPRSRESPAYMNANKLIFNRSARLNCNSSGLVILPINSTINLPKRFKSSNIICWLYYCIPSICQVYVVSGSATYQTFNYESNYAGSMLFRQRFVYPRNALCRMGVKSIACSYIHSLKIFCFSHLIETILEHKTQSRKHTVGLILSKSSTYYNRSRCRNAIYGSIYRGIYVVKRQQKFKDKDTKTQALIHKRAPIYKYIRDLLSVSVY